jgi:hypothetical protein
VTKAAIARLTACARSAADNLSNVTCTIFSSRDLVDGQGIRLSWSEGGLTSGTVAKTSDADHGDEHEAGDDR